MAVRKRRPRYRGDNAQLAIERDQVSEAQVYAILARASAVNRLAAAEVIADAQGSRARRPGAESVLTRGYPAHHLSA